MGQLVVVVEEGEVQFAGVVQMSHHDGFAKLGLTIFEDVNIFGYLSAVFVMVLMFQIDMPVGVDIIQNGANFGKTRQNLSEQHLRFTHFPRLQFFGTGFFDFFVDNIFGFIFGFDMPHLHMYFSMRRIMQFQFTLQKVT